MALTGTLMDPQAGFLTAPILCELPATGKLRKLLNLRPPCATNALRPALEIMPKDANRHLLWR
jgi:hypothetical protein